MKIVQELKRVKKKAEDKYFRARSRYIRYYDTLPIDDKCILLESQHGANINGNIFYHLRGQFQDSLCAIFMENLDFCYCEDSEDYVIPDIMIICDRKNLKKGTYRGIPKFIVETLSPSTAFRDRTKKKEIDESCGVEEYWIVSSLEKAVEIYYLGENGSYSLKDVFVLDDDISSPSYNGKLEISLKAFPHVYLRLEEIFENL